MKNYITIKEISKIYNISQKTVNMILRNHKIDSFKSKKWLVVNFKDFHKAYTSTYNPSLLSYTEKKPISENRFLIFADVENSFLNIFSKPYKPISKRIFSK